jgi:hypothetical protein
MTDENNDLEMSLEEAEVETALEGLDSVEEGLVDIAMSENLGDASQMMAAAAASDITRGIDAGIVASRAAALSDAINDAGIADFGQGAAMLAASEDLDVQSALMGALGEEDMADAMSLAAISGQLGAVATIVDSLEMPILAAFLLDKSDELHDLAVGSIYQSSSARALAAAIGATGKDISELGTNEVAEGLARLSVSDAMAARSAELAEAGVDLTAAGLVQAAAAEGLREASKDLAAEGIGEVAAGAAGVGSADTLDALAEELDEEDEEEGDA